MFIMEQDQNTTNQEAPDPTTLPPFLGDEEPETDPGQAQNVFNVYIVKQEPEPDTEEDTPQVVPTEDDPTPAKKKRSLLPVLLLSLVFTGIISGIAAGIYLPSLLQPSITITIIPVQKQLTTTTTLTLVTDKLADKDQLQGRALPTITMSQQQTVPTTGKGHQDAKPATGSITFYNAAPYSQSIPVGTLFIASDGTQVVTDATAFLPAANMPTVGQATIPAHSAQPGTQGNIPVSAACCRVNVFAKNTTAFTGGQEARDFQMVKQQDIDTAASSLKSSLLQSRDAALQAELKPNEAVITPNCSPTTTSDHPVNSEATTVTVTVSETCQAIAYNKPALQQRIMQQQTAEGRKQFGTGYTLSGTLQTTITQTTAKQDSFILTVQAKATLVYHFTEAQVTRLTRQIAGKTEAPATQILLRTPGVQQVSFGDFNGSLPQNPEKITFLLLTGQ